jgi:hypothetical protein
MKGIIAGCTTVSQPVLSPSTHATGELPTAPEQIWRWLTPIQQQRVFQVVVRVCHQMAVDCQQEVYDEQP